MEKSQQEEFALLCDSVTLILDSYNQKKYLPNWLFRLWHPRGKQVVSIKQQVELCKNSVTSNDSFEQKIDELIVNLDKNRYFLNVHSASKRLLDKVQDTMVAGLFFSKADIVAYRQLFIGQHNIAAYLKELEQKEHLALYADYYRKQHSIFGRKIERFTEEEIIIAAKSGMINGKLVDRFGVRKIIPYGLDYVQQELQTLLDKKQFAGFLTPYIIEGHLDKIKLLRQSSKDKDVSEATLVQQGRYLLEIVTNATGVLPSGAAKYPQHSAIVACCFWVDEMFQQAKARFDVV